MLHLAAGKLFGGVESMLLSLHVNGRSAPRLEQEFAFFYSGPVVARLADLGAAVHEIGPVRASRPSTIGRALVALHALQRRAPYDIVICHGAWVQALFTKALRTIVPNVVTWVHTAPESPGWEERMARYSPPDLVIFNSRFTAQKSRRWCSGVRQAVIYPPVTGKSATPRPRSSLRAELGVEPSEPVIVFVGRFDRAKGHELFIEALSRVPNGWKAWIVGGPQSEADEACRRDVEARAAELGVLGRVTFLGERSDVGELLPSADLYCQPNVRPEPFGIAYVEALYAGLPVVTTAMGGALEIVDDTCGMLVEVDAGAVAAALERLSSDSELRRRLGSAAPLRAKTLCDPEDRLRELESLLATLGRRGRPLPEPWDASPKSSSRHRVSVLVPTWGRPRDLVRCLEALDAQTLKPTEIVVGTRADDVETVAALDAAARTLGVELKRATTRKPGLIASMNAALELCRGDVIAITDDDAEPLGDWLERLVSCFEDPRVGGAGGRDLQAHETAPRRNVGRVQWFGRVIGNHHLGIGGPRHVDALKGVNCAFRAPLLRALGFDARLAGVGMQLGWELSLCLSLRHSGWLLVYDPSILVKHHVAPRHADDPDRLHRGVFTGGPHSDAVHNETLAVLEHGSPASRIAFALFALFVGTSAAPGLAQLPRLLARGDAKVFERWQSTLDGRLRGMRRFRAERAGAP